MRWTNDTVCVAVAVAVVLGAGVGCDGPQRYEGEVLEPGDTIRVEITEIGGGTGQTERTVVEVGKDGTAVIPPFGRFRVAGKPMGEVSRAVSREAERQRGFWRYMVVIKR